MFQDTFEPERPAANSAIKRTMCSGLLQATVILTLVAHVDVGLRRRTRAAHTCTAAHCLRSVRRRQSLSTLAMKRHGDEAKRVFTSAAQKRSFDSHFKSVVLADVTLALATLLSDLPHKPGSPARLLNRSPDIWSISPPLNVHLLIRRRVATL